MTAKFVCAACNQPLGYLESDEDTEAKAYELATKHRPVCTASEEEYQQAIIDLKFLNLTEGLEL